jgi:hypothetical protein
VCSPWALSVPGSPVCCALGGLFVCAGRANVSSRDMKEWGLFMLDRFELERWVKDIDDRLRRLEDSPDRSENRCFEPFMSNGVFTPCNNTLGWHNRPDVYHPFNESLSDAVSAWGELMGQEKPTDAVE